MSDMIQVQFAAMQQGSDDIKKSARVIDQQLTDLASYLQGLEGFWSGNAHGNYLQQKHRWQSAAEDLNTILTTLAVVLDEATSNYQAAESDLIRIWG